MRGRKANARALAHELIKAGVGLAIVVIAGVIIYYMVTSAFAEAVEQAIP